MCIVSLVLCLALLYFLLSQQEEKNIEILRRKERSEAHLYMQVTVMLEDAFVGHQGFDLFDHEKFGPATFAYTRTFRVLKTTKPHEFLKTLSETFVRFMCKSI